MARDEPGKAKRQPTRVKEWQDGLEFTVGVLTGKADTPLAIFFFKRAEPAGMMVDESPWMSGHKGPQRGSALKSVSTTRKSPAECRTGCCVASATD